MDSNNSDANYGSDTWIHVKTDGQTRRAYLRFDLSAVPAGATVTSAKLYLYCTAGNPQPLLVDVHETSDSWSEGIVTWNNAPAVGAFVASNATVDGIDKYYSWNITSYTQLQFDGDQILSVVVKFPQDDPSQNNPNYHRDFASKEYSGTSCDPYLEIAYVTYVNTPPSISGLPDLELDEDTSLDNAIDLWNYASDAETPDENLIFSVLSVTEPDVGVTIESNRYIDVQPTANWYGTSEVTIQVSDGELTHTDSFNITVNPLNDQPVVIDIPNVTFPEDGSDSSVDLDDYVSDADNTDPEMTWTFTGNVDIIVSIDENNVVTFTAPADWFGQETITFRATDPGSLWSEDATTVTVTSVNDPPVASDLAISPPSPVTTDNLVGSYTYSDAEGDPESGSEIRWYKDGLLQSAFNNSLTVPSSATAKDQVWYFTVRPKDGTAFGALQTSPSVTIQNSPPTTAPVVEITPQFPLTTDDLVCTITTPSIDPDGDTVTYTYEWYKNDELQTDLTTNTVPASYTAPGEVWKCVVTPYGSGPGPPGWDQVTIQNSPPALDPIGPQTVNEENLLSFTATATDPEVPPQTLTFSLGPGAPPGASITSDGYFTWTPTEAQGPGNYNINITVSDGTDIDYEIITVTVNEVNLPPVLNPIGPKTVTEGTLLQFTLTASDPDIPAQTLTYSASNLPPGATFNPSTRVFSWTPTSGQAGVYSGVHFEVTDGYLTDSEDITITVTAPPPTAVGGYATPIDIAIGKEASHSLSSQIGLALALLAAMAATILLTKRRSKTLK